MEENVMNNAMEEPTLKSYRSAAKSALSGHWVNAVLCTLVVTLIVGVCSALSGVSESLPLLFVVGFALTLLIAVPLGFGYSVALLRHMHGEPDDDLVTRPFQAFKDYGRYLGTSLLMTVYVFLWSLLFIIPGIIMGYAYAMTPYIMHDCPDLDASDCIHESRVMMKGYKWKLFCLDLSFIGWALLCILTLGIGFLWLQPYIEASHAKFYDELKARRTPSKA